MSMICDYCGKPIEMNHKAVRVKINILDTDVAWPKRFYHKHCAEELFGHEFSYRKAAAAV